MRVEPGSLHLQSLPYHTKPPPPTTTLAAHDLSHILSHSLLKETLSYTLGPKLQHTGLTALTPASHPVSTLTIQAQDTESLHTIPSPPGFSLSPFIQAWELLHPIPLHPALHQQPSLIMVTLCTLHACSSYTCALTVIPCLSHCAAWKKVMSSVFCCL